MSAIDEKKLDKKLRLMRSAYELFSKKGVNTTAIDEVVKAAGVAKGTFYLYFKDKHDLIDQVVISESRDVVHKIVDELRESDCESPEERLEFVFGSIIDCMLGNKQLASVVHKNLSACYRWIIKSDDETVKADLAVLRQPFIDSGMSDTQAQISLYLLSDMVSNTCCEAILGTAPYTVDEIRPQLHFVINKIIEQ